jgi:hypothetical protein
MNGDKLAQLAAVPIERYQHLFENSTGIDLHNYIYAAFEYRKIGNATDDMKKVISNAEEALKADWKEVEAQRNSREEVRDTTWYTG